MHLDAGAAAEATERRRVRLDTRLYPLIRALGYQLLIGVVVAHDAIVFGRVAWVPVLVFALVAESYVLLSWLAVRRWFLSFPVVLGWDLSDLFFAADLLLWAAAIHITGGPMSLLWVLPLIRVADHYAVPKVWVFVHLAPLTYALAAFWPPRPPMAPGVEVDLLKMGILYVAGLYLAWAGIPVRRFREQREAALSAGAALLAQLTERTERLDHARRSRSALLEELSAGVRTSLIEIVGFSRFLLRSGGFRSDAEQSYVERIHGESKGALRALDRLAEGSAAALWPRVSLSGILQQAATEEAADTDTWRESAVLELPYGDVQIRADATRLKAMLRHTLAACRHFQRGPPRVEVRIDPATGLPEAVLVSCAARALAHANRDELFNPFSVSASGDQSEMAARLELSIARSISRSLGYDVDVAADPHGTTVSIQLR